MLLQTNLFNEVEVGIQNVLRRLVVKYTDEQCHNAFHNQRIALGLEVNLSIGIVGL